MAAALAEQLRAQHLTTIISKEYNGTMKFRGFLRSFETFERLHDQAGMPPHRQAMDPEMKKKLLIATLRDPLHPPTKEIDGQRFVGLQSFIADLPDEQIKTFDAVVNLLTAKYDHR